MLAMVRSVMRPFADRSSKFPIETVVAAFVFTTLAYFHIVQAIKHSAFFALPPPQSLRHAYAILTHDKTWITVPEGRNAVAELVQITFNSPHPSDSRYKASVNNITNYLMDQVHTSDGNTFAQSLCFKVKGSCFVSQDGATVALAFQSGTAEPWLAALGSAVLPVLSNGVHVEVEHVHPESIAEMRSGKWVAYAARALVVRFWDLSKQADSADILVVLFGYILMHGTFIRLFLAGRKLGSNLWLPIAMLSSSIAAFILSLPMALYLGIPMDPIGLSEALPFFVIAIGFDKAMQLARAVFSHPHFLLPSQASATSPVPIKSAREVVLDAVDQVGNSVVRDYTIEVIVLLAGASSRVTGLKEFCALAALTLTIDCVALFTFYIAILTVLVEVHRIKALRTSLPSRSSPETTSLFHRLSRNIFGEKGSANNSVAVNGERDYAAKEPENPAGRLKLLLIVSFLSLHILNLCTTLTPDAAIARHRFHATHRAFSTVDSGTYRKVDIVSHPWVNVLSQLGEVVQSSFDAEINPMVVKVFPPTSLRMLSFAPTSVKLDGFITGWSTLLNDPALNKWIVFVLALSVFLNGYLLKGLTATAARTTIFKQEQTEAKVAKPQTTDTIFKKQEQTEAKAAKPQRTDNLGFAGEVSSVPHSSSVRAGPQQQTHVPQMVAPVALPTPQFSRMPSPDANVQPVSVTISKPSHIEPSGDIRSFEECVEIFECRSDGVNMLNDEEIILLSQKGKIAAYSLEKVLGDLERAVRVRRALISRASDTQTLEHSLVPMKDYDYSLVLGACCENVVGYTPLPLGIAGPLRVDGKLFHIPMATAEGTLVASTSRGCKALNAGGGVTTIITNDSMTRGPVVDFPSAYMAGQACSWVNSPEGITTLSEAFNSTSRYARLQKLMTRQAGRTVFIRFSATTGDAMGMNMISKGVERALECVQMRFPEMQILALSGNFCTDKKPSAINWIEGRGKGVVAEAVIPGKIVKSVLKTTVEALCNLNLKKNLIGSAMAGSIGGFNAHASNILTAIFLATGQDPAQNVESSNCMTLFEPTNNGQDLRVSVTMPSIEVGTVGGGTVLAPQQAILDMLGIRGSHPTIPGENARQLARIIAAAVMAGELSLMGALAAGHLIRAHLQHNRSQPVTPAITRPVTPAITRPASPTSSVVPLPNERARTAKEMMRDNLRVSALRHDQPGRP